MKNIFFFLLLSVCFWSCEKTVLLDLNQNVPRVIIEGQITNHPGYQYIRVTKSSGFYESGGSPAVENAVVSIADDQGNVMYFNHNPNNKSDSSGYYKPDAGYVGVVGRSYKLQVTVDDQLYEATDDLSRVTAIDSLASRISTDEQEDPKDYGRFYEVLLYAKEPPQTKDFYLFKFYRNDSLKFYNDTDIYFADDEILGEDIAGVPSPIYFAPGDKARVEMYSISRNGFVFFSDLQSLLNSDGGLFSQPPSNSRTNLSNGALGFFQASAVDVREMTIKE